MSIEMILLLVGVNVAPFVGKNLRLVVLAGKASGTWEP